ncbi:hypothetical protein AaE_005267, partial [Aphanomyces astaci]
AIALASTTTTSLVSSGLAGLSGLLKKVLPPAPIAAVVASSSTPVVLPKNWARRTDAKTGRLYYVNLLTKKSFARLPSSVSASMVQKTNPKDKDDKAKRPVTVPQSPQFSQMSWQRKTRTSVGGGRHE